MASHHAPAAHHGDVPIRSATTRSSDVGGGYISDDDAPAQNNPTNTNELLTERLQAWKHMCGYLENYISEVAKDQKSQAKDQGKILKSLSHPLKEAHHFDQALGGVAGLFENLRANTQAQSTLHEETSKNLTGTVLPILERLHSEIKHKAKEIEKGAGKGSKAVSAARDHSQKHIELLGQNTASFDAAGHKSTAATDPYVLQRQVYHRLNKQLQDENNNRGDLIAVQNGFASFEAHVIQTVQTALNQYNQFMSGQADRQRAMYGDVAATAGRIPPDFEWRGFLHRNSDKLIDPNAPHRTMDTVSFPNQNHRATAALIEGTLERKKAGLGALTGWSSGYFAVTPAGFLHEFKDNDNYAHDPVPETSLHLPDCTIGALDGNKFTIKGKSSAGNKLTSKMHTSTEYNFRANSTQDAAQWHNIIASQTNATSSVPTSPVEAQKVAPAPLNTQTHSTVPVEGTPHSAGGVAPQSATGTLPPQTVATGQTSVPQSATSQHAPAHFTSEATGAEPLPEKRL